MKNFDDLCSNLDFIPLEKFLNIVSEDNKKIEELNKALGLLGFLNAQNETIRENLKFLAKYIDILELLLFTIELKTLKRRKGALKIESEIAQTYKNSSDLSATSDLLKKIKKSIENNRKKASYLEGDYFLQKNQIDQIEKSISNYELDIEHLNSQMKMCFSQINQISRLTEKSPEESKNEALKSLGININLPNSEKIRMLQLKAKEISYSIKQVKSKKEDLIVKLNKIYPKYEIYKSDYQKILSTIERDDKKSKELQSELKQKLREKDGNLIEEEITDVNVLRPLDQINEDIKKVDSELAEIIQSKDKKEQDLSSIKEKLGIFSIEVSKRIKELTINKNKANFLKIINNYRKFELILTELENIVNNFLLEINLLTQFKILINETSTELFVSTLFKRNDNEGITLNELTTPEKVFFIVALYLSICIILKKKYIIFSNLFIPNDYNKSGSILRTIRKIIPIFENIDSLKNFNLILILSNIEIKKEIKYLKIFEIKEN